MLESLASLEDFEDRIAGGIAEEDATRAQAVLDDASALVRAEAGKSWMSEAGMLESDIPDVILTIVMKAAKRAFTNPDEVRSESIDNYSTSYGDVYLTKTEVSLVRGAAGIRGGLWTQSTTRTEPDFGSDLPDVSQDADEVHDAGPLSDFFPQT